MSTLLVFQNILDLKVPKERQKSLRLKIVQTYAVISNCAGHSNLCY